MPWHPNRTPNVYWKGAGTKTVSNSNSKVTVTVKKLRFFYEEKTSENN